MSIIVLNIRYDIWPKYLYSGEEFILRFWKKYFFWCIPTTYSYSWMLYIDNTFKKSPQYQKLSNISETESWRVDIKYIWYLDQPRNSNLLYKIKTGAVKLLLIFIILNMVQQYNKTCLMVLVVGLEYFNHLISMLVLRQFAIFFSSKMINNY